jgi:N-methylhydantoinase B/oxoprolinase/acetone carboxylase alpha subunit
VFGGTDAIGGKTTLYRGDEVIIVPPKASLSFQKGDVIEIAPGGGGGYGLPAKRQPDARDADAADGMVRLVEGRVAAE